MAPLRVLVACEFSGVVRDAFRSLGHDAVSCDLLPTQRPGPHIQDDVLRHLDDGWDLMIAHPPCNRLLSSGAKHWNEWRMTGEQQAAINFFLCLWSASIQRIAIENPPGIMTRVLFKPQYIQPWQFGHMESKKTGLWLKNLPDLQPTNDVYAEMLKLPKRVRERVHYESPGIRNGLTRSQRRSIMFTGIANAMAIQWEGQV